MPIPTQLTQEDVAWLTQQGIDPSTVQIAPQQPTDQMSKLGAVAARLKGNAGGIIGGGGGMMGGIIGGLGGSYAGQKAQEAVLPEQLNQKLQEQSQLAEEQHPIVSGITDLSANMLAGGMRPSIGNLKGAVSGLRGLGTLSAEDAAINSFRGIGPRQLVSKTGQEILGDRADLVKVGTAAMLNPAVQTGISLAQGQGIPSVKELGESALGGALFSEQSALGRGVHNKLTGGEPTPEASSKITPDIDNTTGTGQETTTPATTIWNETVNDKYKLSDEAVIDAYRNANYTKVKGLGVNQRAEAITKNAALNEMLKSGDVEAMRNSLHQGELAKQEASEPYVSNTDEGLYKLEEPTEEPTELDKFLMSKARPPVNQRAIDFQKAQAEEMRQRMVAEQPKPLSPNSIRIQNLESKILPSDITRPEQTPDE